MSGSIDSRIDSSPKGKPLTTLVKDQISGQPCEWDLDTQWARSDYNYDRAEDGFEGLAIAETLSGTIDLLITDVVLPGLHGRAVAARLKLRRPGLQVL
jgi:CheY-like chemotaxis protein